MEMTTVLKRIAARLEVIGETEASVSRRATGSPDSIRNWRRRVARGENPGASIITLEAIADALKVSRAWLEGEGPIDLTTLDEETQARARMLEVYDSLPDASSRRAAELQIRALKQALSPNPDAAGEAKARPKEK